LKQFADNTAFAHDLRSALEAHWTPCSVSFRGSFASNLVDAYSDVNLMAKIDRPLDKFFYTGLVCLLEDGYRPMAFWYDPDHKDNPQARQVRFSFYHLPIFWRVDLEIESAQPCPAKYPDPFPEFSIIRSALWNLVWAVKYAGRGKAEEADHYVAAACEKLQKDPLTYSPEQVQLLLDALAAHGESNPKLIAMLGAAL
jgi:hypothetical protein